MNTSSNILTGALRDLGNTILKMCKTRAKPESEKMKLQIGMRPICFGKRKSYRNKGKAG